MSWKEKIENYIKDEDLKKNVAKNNIEEQKTKFYEERVPSFLKVIEDYKCINLLKEIRDEVWGQGEISIKKPKIKELEFGCNYTSLFPPLMVSALLTTEVPCYEPGYWRDVPHESYMGSEFVDSPHIENKTENLAIHAIRSKDLSASFEEHHFLPRDRDDIVVIDKIYDRNHLPDFLFIINDRQDNHIFFNNSFFIEVNEKEKTIEELKKFLIKDCAGRNRSTFKYNAQKIIRMIDSGKNLTFPTRFEYLLSSRSLSENTN